MTFHTHYTQISTKVSSIASADWQTISQAGQRGINAVIYIFIQSYHTLLYFWVCRGEELG